MRIHVCTSLVGKESHTCMDAYTQYYPYTNTHTAGPGEADQVLVRPIQGGVQLLHFGCIAAGRV